VIAHVPKSDDLDEYVMWGFSARREAFASPTKIEELSGEKYRHVSAAEDRVSP
jgi:hypothetical protein